MAAETVRIEIPIETIDETEPEISNIERKLGKVSKAEKEMGQSATRAGQQVSKFDRTASKTAQTLNRLTKGRYAVLLEAKDRIAPILSALHGKLKGIAGKSWRVTLKAADMATHPIRGVLNLLKNPLLTAGAVLGVGVGIKDTIDTYRNFEEQMSKVGAISGATAVDMSKLTERAKALGATTKFTSAEVGQGFEYMSMAGWKTKDMMEGIEGILNLAAASGADLGTTSDIVTDALTAFKTKASDAGHFADVMAAASANANTNVSMMGETFKYAGAMAGTLGYSIEDVALMTGLMANSGIKATMSGTALNMIFTRLSTNAGHAREQLESLGISFFDSKGNARDLSDVMEALRKKTKGMNDEQKAHIANVIAGTQSQKGLLAILNASNKDYGKLKKSIENADGAAANMSETMMDNLQGSLTKLQSALDGVKVSFGERLSPYVRGMADWLTDQMPMLEKGLDGLMDMADRKIESMQRKFEEITQRTDWQESGIFGKGKILWDEFITEPFSEWWNSEGKARIAATAGDIGKGIGTGLNAGIMTLLGFDTTEVNDAGTNAGIQFAKGFSEGFDFDAVSKKLWEGFGNIVKNAGKLLPGGEAADLSSLISAGLLMKILTPLVKGGSGMINFGKTVSGLFGSGGTASAAGSVVSGTAGTGLLRGMIGSTGNAMVGGSGILGKFANAGYALNPGNTAGMYFGSTAGTMSGGAAAALGGASVIGGALGAAEIIHGGYDLVQGFHTDDKEKAKAYKTAGAIEIGGTLAGAGAGAATGAAIGALFGGVGAAPGALIGAGIGAVGSFFAAKKVKDDYKERAKEAKKTAEIEKRAYEITGMELDKIKTKSGELEKVLKNSNRSAEEITTDFIELTALSLSDHFGEVSLSLKDVKRVADDIVFSKYAKKMETYSGAAEKASSSLSKLTGSMTEMEKANWKVERKRKSGLKLDELERDSYKQSIDDYVSSAQEYLENKHFEATASVELIAGKKGGKDIISKLDSAYGKMEGSMTKLKEAITKKTEKALEDGVISAKEEKAIQKLQRKISNISERITGAQEQASLESLKIQFGSGELDSASFKSLQEQLAANTAEMQSTYNDALQTNLTNLEMMKPDLKAGEYDKMYKEIVDSYNSQIDGLNARSVDFQLDVIADRYKEELDGILPEITGTTKDKLSTAMSEAFIISDRTGTGAADWSQEDIAKWFGLDKLTDPTARDNLVDLIRSTAESVTKESRENIIKAYQESLPTAEDLYRNVSPTKLVNMEMFEGNTAELQEQAKQNAETIASMLQGLEPQEARLKVKWLLEDTGQYSLDNLGKAGSAISNLHDQAMAQMKAAGTTTGVQFGNSASGAIANGTGVIRSAMENSVQSAASSPITPNVTISPNYQVTQPSSSLFNFQIPTIRPNVTVDNPSKHAAGGYVSGGPQLSWLAEEGYGEYVIPTNPARRSRALSLWEQAGDTLGVAKNAAGGFVSGANRAVRALSSKIYPNDENSKDEGNTSFSEPNVAYAQPIMAAGAAPNITISVTLNPSFTVEGSEGNVLDAIRAEMNTIADEVAGNIAERIGPVFRNMPAESEG